MNNAELVAAYKRLSRQLEQALELIDRQGKEIELLTTRNARLQEQLRLAVHHRFGASSEQRPAADYEQESLFNEAEALAAPSEPEPEVEVITYRRHKQKGHRDAEFEGMPVETIEVRLSDEDRICCCGGFMQEIGFELHREVKAVPARGILVETKQFKYGCRECARTGLSAPVKIAPMPARPIPGSWASASLIAFVMFSKFVMGLPLYRQEQHSSSMGVKLP
jgi:transposase